jgi:hypothetical protein
VELCTLQPHVPASSYCVLSAQLQAAFSSLPESLPSLAPLCSIIARSFTLSCSLRYTYLTEPAQLTFQSGVVSSSARSSSSSVCVEEARERGGKGWSSSRCRCKLASVLRRAPRVLRAVRREPSERRVSGRKAREGHLDSARLSASARATFRLPLL